MAGDHDYFGSVIATYVFLAELGLSTSLLLVVLATVLYSSTIHRSAVSVNVYLTFLIYSFSYLILLIFGQWNVSEPPMGVCLFSATMAYASFPLCAAAVLALSISVWMNVFHHGSSHPIFERSLIVVPYVIWVGLIIESLVIGSSRPSEVVRHDYPYCIIENPIPGQTSRLLLAICLIPSMVFQTITLIRLFSVANPFSENPALRRAMRKRVIRMCIFNLGSVGALALSLSFSITTHGSTIQVVIQGSCPLWAVLVFGTQSEMFESWLRWIRREPVPSETESKAHLVSISSIPSLERV